MHTGDCPYDENYFLRGEASGRSNYTDYRWMEERTIAFARRLVDHLGIQRGQTFLDVGCALGFTVKALRRIGVQAWGYDISEWAINNCDPEITPYVRTSSWPGHFDYMLLKDVAEHLEPGQLRDLIDRLTGQLRKAMLLIVPLSGIEGGRYIRDADNKDVTHIIRWPLEAWLRFVQRQNEEFIAQASWHIPGLKPTSLSSPSSCGFITIRRYEAITPESLPISRASLHGNE